MPRRREVTKEESQKRAMYAFWKHGYKQLGVRALEEATGINRFSLQTEYGGKAGLFLSVLDDYLDLTRNHMMVKLFDGGLEDISALFLNRASNDTLPEESRCGCLLINTACQDDGVNPDISARVTDFFQLIDDAFTSALENEQAKGVLKQGIDIKQAAEFLRGELVGINVIAKAYGDNTAALPAAEFTVDIIRGWEK
jgi:TetR/AcrR family transcriptional regulator, transcriptional repressor for nem operon